MLSLGDAITFTILGWKTATWNHCLKLCISQSVGLKLIITTFMLKRVYHMSCIPKCSFRSNLPFDGNANYWSYYRNTNKSNTLRVCSNYGWTKKCSANLNSEKQLSLSLTNMVISSKSQCSSTFFNTPFAKAWSGKVAIKS